MFEDISEIAENCAYLKATAGPRPNTKLFRALPPYAELATLEVRAGRPIGETNVKISLCSFCNQLRPKIQNGQTIIFRVVQLAQ